MSEQNLFFIVISAVLINNFVLMRFLGLCPFLGVSRKVETAIGMGMAVIFVMTMAGSITWMIQHFLLARFDILYLQTVAFILVVASLVQLVEMVVRKVSPTLYEALGIFLPLITTNCAVLGLALINILEEYTFIQTVTHSIGAGLGWTLAIVIFAGIRERLELSELPKSVEGFAAAFIVAGLLSLAFLGFAGFLSA